MRLGVLFLAAVAIALPSAALTAQATATDTSSAIAAVQRLFDAINTGDTTLLRGLLVPGMQFVTITDPPAAAAPPRVQVDSAFARQVGASRQQYLERMWQPVVRLQGSIATVWAPYDFHVDGKFSHCGVDTFTLLRVGQGWQIASVVYTVQRSGCPASSLGAPR